MTLEDAQRLEAQAARKPERKAADRPERPDRPPSPSRPPAAGTPADPVQPAVNAPEEPQQTQVAQGQRPPGELGGHTVQDWEQKAVGTGTGSTSRATPSVPATSKSDMGATSQADFPAKAAATPATPTGETVGGERRGTAPDPTAQLGGSDAQNQGAPRASTNVQQPPAAGEGHEALIDAICKSLAEMIARAVKQSVAEAVESAMGPAGASGSGQAGKDGGRSGNALPPAAPNTGSADAAQATAGRGAKQNQGNPGVKEPPKPGPAAA